LYARAVRFEQYKRNRTLTKKSVEELCILGMMRAAIEKIIAIRKVYDELKEKEKEENLED
jgi:hypothetical protein